MDITKIDPNFKSEDNVAEGARRYVLPCEPFRLCGLHYYENEGFLRMPQAAADTVSMGVANSHATAGGRILFGTNSKTFRVDMRWRSFNRMGHMPFSGSAGFVLCERTAAGEVFVGAVRPKATDEEGYSGSINLPADGKLHDYVLHFPLYNSVFALALELDGDATVTAGRGYRNIPPVLYYGSSITQGGCASRPDNEYQAYLAEWSNTDFINLGFSGQAKGEDAMTDYLASLDCSVFVCDYDHNASGPEYLQNTHERLYRRYREKRPETPIVFVSMPDAWRRDKDGARCAVIRATYEKALAEGDKNVYFVNGGEMFPPALREHCTVDGTHPNDLGFYLMAKKIGAVLLPLLSTVPERKA